MSHTKPCAACAGSGRVKREPRRLMGADGKPGELDPLDILGRFEGVCDACGGAGEVPFDPRTIPEARGGYAADMIAAAMMPLIGRVNPDELA